MTGDPASFSVTASGSTPLYYQWRKNGVAITGATTRTYSLAAATINDAADYTVVVNNAYGTATSSAATLTVWVPPSITAQPQSQTAVVGTGVSFSVTGSGTPAPSYQWRFNGVGIPGATASSLVLSAVAFADAGDYQVVLNSSAGSVASAVATLTVVCPAITVGPASLPGGKAGQAYSQTLSASGGAPPYTYATISGSLPPGLNLSADGVLSGTPLSLGNFSFSVRATDANGCAGTNGFAVAITCPTITVGPASLPSVLLGSAYSQALSASGGLGSYSYAVTGGVLPAGLNLSAAGVLSGAPSAIGTSSFTVTATDGNGCAGSQLCTLAVTGAPPVITQQPLSGTNVLGTDASFSVAGSGTPAPTYEWQLNGTAIPGATSSSLLRSAVTYGDAGSYRVVLSNVAGSVTSAVATLTVVCPSVTVGPATLPGGVVGSAYSQNLTASGGLGTYSYSVTGGTLPAGLSLSSAGVLSGTPSAIGTNSFTATATDTYGCSGSQTYTVAVAGVPPVITQQPQSVTVVAAGSASFSVVASGTAPLSYQWQFNGTNLGSAIGTSLTLTNVQSGNAGSYRVIVANTAGSVTSSVATLTVGTARGVADYYATTPKPGRGGRRQRQLQCDGHRNAAAQLPVAV